MSKTNKIFEKVPVQIQNYSGFDLSHYNLGTATCGTLVPVLTEPLAPGDKISLGVLAQVDFPPLATNFYGRVDYRLEAFFVPYRIVLKQWQKFMRYKNSTQQDDIAFGVLPKLRIPYSALGPGSLADYLGFKKPTFDSGNVDFPNPLPFLAYHKIYDDWYRDKLLQQPVFTEELAVGVTNVNRIRNLPNYAYATQNVDILDGSITESAPLQGDVTSTTLENNSKFFDGHLIWNLRQRNFHKDYLTSSTTQPQAGDPVALKFETTVTGETDDEGQVTGEGNGSFTIAALRTANSLQKFVERNNLAGDDYADQIQARFGVRPSDSAINYPIYLGSQSYNVYNRSVFQTAPDNTATTANPFSSQGAEFGKASSMGSGSLVGNFECTEHGLLMVIGSIVPHSFYSSGIRRYLYAHDISDFPEPILATVGDQPVYMGEVSVGNVAGEVWSKAFPFGYQGRYSEYKYHEDEVHAELIDGQSLEAFAIQRSFGRTTELGSSFIQIPKDMMDQVMATSVGLSKFTAWYDLYFELHKASKLPVYCVPTLGNDMDTHTELIDKGGKRL